jgi:hypothetical protein
MIGANAETEIRNAKRGAMRLPVLTFYALSAGNFAYDFARFAGDTHRVRGVISK